MIEYYYAWTQLFLAHFPCLLRKNVVTAVPKLAATCYATSTYKSLGRKLCWTWKMKKNLATSVASMSNWNSFACTTHSPQRPGAYVGLSLSFGTCWAIWKYLWRNESVSLRSTYVLIVLQLAEITNLDDSCTTWPIRSALCMHPCIFGSVGVRPPDLVYFAHELAGGVIEDDGATCFPTRLDESVHRAICCPFFQELAKTKRSTKKYIHVKLAFFSGKKTCTPACGRRTNQTSFEANSPSREHIIRDPSFHGTFKV